MDRRKVIEYYQNPEYVEQNYSHSLAKRDDKIDILREHMNEAGAVVELGCGGGVYSGLSRRYVGLDISHEAIKRFRRGIVCDISHMPLKTGAAGTVFSLYTLEHIYDPPKVMQEVDRILGRSGVALLKDAWLKTCKTEGVLPRGLRNYIENIATRFARIGRALAGCNRIVYSRMTPDYSKVGEDYDAVSRVDPASVFRWFRSRGYQAVNERRGLFGFVRLFRSRRNWVIVKKEMSASR